MINILLCIAASASLIIILKILQQFRLALLPVITVNYFTAVACAIVIAGKLPNFTNASIVAWLPFALVLGIMFIIVFVLMGQSAQKDGITITAIAQKMSLVIPISAALVLYHEPLTVWKVLGILLALTAIVLTTRKQPDAKEHKSGNLDWLPISVFIGSGVIDATINYVQHGYLVGIPYSDFLEILFGTAGAAGAIMLVYQSIIGAYTFNWKAIPAGIILGVPNFCSMIFLLRSLEFSGLQSSVVYPVLNIGVVVTSTLIAGVVFKEQLSKINLLGIAMAIIAIIVLAQA